MKKTLIAFVIGLLVVLGLPGTASAASEVRYGHAYTTAYSWWDNTPRGSGEVSHPWIKSHKGGAGGVGTYADPMTVAVGHVITNGKDVPDFKPGTRWYSADLRKYFVVEDTCGDGKKPQNIPCHSLKSAPAGTSVWLDFWADGRDVMNSTADKCLSKVTDGKGIVHHLMVKNPKSTYLVEKRPIIDGTTCRAGFGKTLHTA